MSDYYYRSDSVKELLASRCRLEHNILREIQQFEEEVGLQVSSVHLRELIKGYINTTRYGTTDVKVEVLL